MIEVPADAALRRAVTVVRLATFGSLAAYLAVIHAIAPPATEFAPAGVSIVLLGVVIVLALAAIVLRARIARPDLAPGRRLREGLALYAVCDLLGVVALGIWAFEGDLRQATGAILAAAIFATAGLRERRAPDRSA